MELSSSVLALPVHDLSNSIKPTWDQEDFDRHLFALEEWTNINDALNRAWITLWAVNNAMHNILGSRLWVWEYFMDNYGTIYSTGEYLQIEQHLKSEQDYLMALPEKYIWLPEWFIERSLKAIEETLPSVHIEELEQRRTMMEKYPSGIKSLDSIGRSTSSIGHFLVPTPIEQCIWERKWENHIVWAWKSAQIVISTVKNTNEIAWICMTYTTPDFETAFENELKTHYPSHKDVIYHAMKQRYPEIERNGIMVFPIIGMLPKYAGLRSMIRMMRDWWQSLITDELWWVPWIAEMDMTNNFYRVCEKELKVMPLLIVDTEGKPIKAINKRFDYCSSVVTFKVWLVLDKIRQWVSSVIPRSKY